MPYFLHKAETSLVFCTETGCPPALLQVIVSTTKGIFSFGWRLKTFSSLFKSTFPLNGCIFEVSKASSMVQSTAFAFLNSIWPFVVSKCEFPGTMSPSFTNAENNTFSAALP